jgi:hypothetical protein
MLLTESQLTRDQKQALSTVALLASQHSDQPDWSAVAWNIAGRNQALYVAVFCYLETEWDSLCGPGD